jgi:uncharacterized cupin superfamily protein
MTATLSRQRRNQTIRFLRVEERHLSPTHLLSRNGDPEVSVRTYRHAPTSSVRTSTWRVRPSQVRSTDGLETEHSHIIPRGNDAISQEESKSQLKLTIQQQPPYYLFFHLRHSSSRVITTLFRFYITYFAIFGT